MLEPGCGADRGFQKLEGRKLALPFRKLDSPKTKKLEGLTKDEDPCPTPTQNPCVGKSFEEVSMWVSGGLNTSLLVLKDGRKSQEPRLPWKREKRGPSDLPSLRWTQVREKQESHHELVFLDTHTFPRNIFQNGVGEGMPKIIWITHPANSVVEVWVACNLLWQTKEICFLAIRNHRTNSYYQVGVGAWQGMQRDAIWWWKKIGSLSFSHKQVIRSLDK